MQPAIGCLSAAHAQAHWQASQSGVSIEQNLMSVAGVASIADWAYVAATPTADSPPGAMPPLDTAFMAPEVTVDFSACVAPIVRR